MDNRNVWANTRFAPTTPPTQFSQCHILDTGYCLALEAMTVRGGRFRVVHCHAIVALLEHPARGWMLFDTGYAPRLLDATRRWPARLYRLATPMRIEARLSVCSQLKRFGLVPGDIETILLSHLHADHVAGLRDFPGARFVLTRQAFENARELKGLRALKRGFVPELLPDDFEERATFLPRFDGPELGSLGASFDLWQDRSTQLIPFPGHARGQIGLLASTQNGQMFFVADGVWHRASLQSGRGPHPVTNLVVDNAREAAQTVLRLSEFARENPDVTMIPTHCPLAFAELVKS